MGIRSRDHQVTRAADSPITTVIERTGTQLWRSTKEQAPDLSLGSARGRATVLGPWRRVRTVFERAQISCDRQVYADSLSAVYCQCPPVWSLTSSYG